MSIKSVISAISNVSAATFNETQELSSTANNSPIISENAFNSETKRSEQQSYGQSLRSQVEARYAQQQNQTQQQQDKDKLKPKPGERVVTMRGSKVIKTEIVPQPNQRNGALRPRAGTNALPARVMR